MSLNYCHKIRAKLKNKGGIFDRAAHFVELPSCGRGGKTGGGERWRCGADGDNGGGGGAFNIRYSQTMMQLGERK